MAEIGIERQSLDDEDIAALKGEMEELGHEARPTAIMHSVEADRRAIRLDWVKGELGDEMMGALMDAVRAWAQHRFSERRKESPRRIDLYGPTGEVVASVDVPG